jgi:hypothetical protein
VHSTISGKSCEVRISARVHDGDEFVYGAELRKALALGCCSDIAATGILLIADGVEVLDDDILSPGEYSKKRSGYKRIYALMRRESLTSYTGEVSLKISSKKTGAKYMEVRVPCNEIVSNVKKLLKRTEKQEQEQVKLILLGKVVKDECCIGDYVLFNRGDKKKAVLVHTTYTNTSKKVDDINIALSNNDNSINSALQKPTSTTSNTFQQCHKHLRKMPKDYGKSKRAARLKTRGNRESESESEKLALFASMSMSMSMSAGVSYHCRDQLMDQFSASVSSNPTSSPQSSPSK